MTADEFVERYFEGEPTWLQRRWVEDFLEGANAVYLTGRGGGKSHFWRAVVRYLRDNDVGVDLWLDREAERTA